MKCKRSNDLELIDLGPSYYTKEEYEDCLIQLGRIGKYLGGNRASFNHFSKYTNLEKILDVGCGGGAFTLLLGKCFPQAKVIGIDLSIQAIAFAREQLNHSFVKNVQFQVLDLDQIEKMNEKIDIITATLVCHHLKDIELIHFLKQSYHIVNKSVIINDLHRNWLAYFGFALIAKGFFPNRLIYHDGLLSIKKAFKKHDWVDYLKAANIPLDQCKIRWHWPFRWVVTIDKIKENDG